MTHRQNHLAGEESPYLLQHASNPVDWYPWGEEAFEKAKAEDKPILVSIGYATCHWCHVMERESFENESVAAIQNDLFISIKVDREERPDVDHYYMEAVHFLGISGGWPLNVFLTPDRKPYFGGTYYPPEPRYNRPSWTQVLLRMHQAFSERREEVEQQASRLVSLIESESYQLRSKYPANNWLEAAAGSPDHWKDLYYKIREGFDRNEGGFGGAPKFPQVSTLLFLMAYGSLEKENEAVDHVRWTIAKMLAGGIFDQAGGGFARYSVDKAWKIPHFEKMLYDNALLLQVMAPLYLISPDPFLEAGIRQTISFLFREMALPEGGFASAIDADSDGIEGKFYVWSWWQLKALFSDEEMELLNRHLDISPEGNWEDTNILYLRENPALELDAQLAEWAKSRAELAPLLERILKARDGRNRPITDSKVITGWNAMLVTGLFSAFTAHSEHSWKDRGFQLLRYLDQNHRDEEGNLLRLPGGAKRRIRSFLEDEAWMIRAFLMAAQLDPKSDWAERADKQIDGVIEHFYDQERKLFYENRSDTEENSPPVHQIYDSGMPSPNSVMVMNLLEASVLMDRPAWKEIAVAMLEEMAGVIFQFPASLSYWALGLMGSERGMDEWAVLGPEFQERILEIFKKYRPFRVIDGDDNQNEERPLLSGKEVGEETLLYYCTDYACRAPVKEIEELGDLN